MIVDFHAHYSPAFFRYREYRLTLGEMLESMDAHDISRAVLSPAGEYAALLNVEGNTTVADAVRRHPERFIGFAAINPWWRSRALDELKRAREEYGFGGIVLHPILQGFEANDPLVFPLVETAVGRGMIVYVTGGAPYLAMPYKIADLAGRYPSGRFVMGHAGWDFHFDVPYCLEACPNLWAETSRNGLANLESLVHRFGADRLLFGSDYPFSSFEGEIAKIRLLPGLTDVERERIFTRNALALLGVKDRE
jgi:predicted TIM-barrel fold metal-dependent hydrolase